MAVFEKKHGTKCSRCGQSIWARYRIIKLRYAAYNRVELSRIYCKNCDSTWNWMQETGVWNRVKLGLIVAGVIILVVVVKLSI